MAKDKEEKLEKINALVARYQARLEKRVEDGKELPGAVGGHGRMPKGVSEENAEAYVALRDQLKQLKELRRNSVAKLREITEQMDALKGGKKKSKAKPKAKK